MYSLLNKDWIPVGEYLSYAEATKLAKAKWGEEVVIDKGNSFDRVYAAEGARVGMIVFSSQSEQKENENVSE
jgi:hypothetical protein